MEALVNALESFWEVRFPPAQRARWLGNDPAAVQAAVTAALAEGAVAPSLAGWGCRCCCS